MKKDDQFTPVRFSHLTGYAGVGSIVRGNSDFTMAVVDIRFWIDRYGGQITQPIRYVERVKKYLDITKALHLPPTSQVNKNGITENTLPAVIFPSFVKCRNCNRLHNKPWYGKEKDISKDLLCDNCKKSTLEQVTWCAVSSSGGLRDVPWHYICHKESQVKCEEDYSAAYLEIISGPKGKKNIRCTRCNTSNSFEKSNTPFKGNYQPWVNDVTSDAEPMIYTVMEINDPRVYSANKKSAIVIPPESNVDKNSIVYKLSCNSTLLNNINNETGFKRKRMLVSTANEFRCTVADINNALREIEEGQSELDGITFGEMYSDEYKALMKRDDFSDGVDFITRHKTEVWLEYKEGISIQSDLKRISHLITDLVAVDRLRVIEVFNGFSRKASDANNDNEEEVILPPDIIGELDWLPAIELYGEGIFFTINQEVLNEWGSAHEVRLRANEIEIRYETSTVATFDNLDKITPRFILLHTLAHLIIRELEISVGYPAASLKERIYCSESEGMAGVLIYTSVADTAGSLGGIVESAEPKNFLKLLEGAFKHAQWCSLDPVCTEHEGQGPSWLNRAACHACALIPETSCEYGNILLDRVFIKGNERLQIPSLLDFIGND